VGCIAKSDAKRGSALSPQRVGRVAQRMEVPLGWPPMEIRWDAPRAFVLGFNTMLPALKAILFGLLFSWASKRKVTRLPAGSRNARCVSGPVAGTHGRREHEKLKSKTASRNTPRPPTNYTLPSKPFMLPRNSPLTNGALKSPL